MARYSRLNGLRFDTDDSELFEVGEVRMNFLDKFTEGDAALGHSVQAEVRAQPQKSVRDHIYMIPSTEVFSKLQNSKGFRDNRLVQQHQKLQEKQNIENGNPNVCPPDPTTQPTVVAICSHSTTATGAALQEQQPQGGGGKGGASPSGRWVGRNIEERSGRWRTVGCDSANFLDNSVNINSSAPSSRATCVQWTQSYQRGTPYREREPALDHLEPFSSRVITQPQHSQPHEKQHSALHSSCIDVCQCQKFPKESSPREGQFNPSIQRSEKRSHASVTNPKSDASYGGPFRLEKGPIFQRSSSAREAPTLQRSGSAKDTPRQTSEMSIENWSDQPASKSAHVSDRTKHRVSFSLTENHEVEALKLREKFRESTAPCKKVLQAKKQAASQQLLRYNYEQPGFVEQEKENICAGKAYTIYGVTKAEARPKASSGPHHQLVRAFSVRENGSKYTKMPRAHSVNAGGRHIMPMECDSCGKGGIGIVFLGLPGDDSNYCKACKSSSAARWRCGEGKPQKKKKSIMHYCRKILRLPQKSS